VFVAIDDRARVAYAEMFRAETAAAAARFLHGAVAFFRRMGIEIKSLLTDNGSAFVSEAVWNGVPATADLAQENPALPSADERQGRAIHPDPAQGLGYVRADRSSSARFRAMATSTRKLS
jgi:hypothetical protein